MTVFGSFAETRLKSWTRATETAARRIGSRAGRAILSNVVPSVVCTGESGRACKSDSKGILDEDSGDRTEAQKINFRQLWTFPETYIGKVFDM